MDVITNFAVITNVVIKRLDCIYIVSLYICNEKMFKPIEKRGRVAQSGGHLTRQADVLGPIPGLATYFRFSFR